MLEEEKDGSEDISGFGRQIEGMGRAAVGWLVLFCCCADAFAKDETPKPDAAITVGRGAVPAGMVWIPGTVFIMGTDDVRSFQVCRHVTLQSRNYNVINRFSVGTKNKDLKLAADGSLTIYVQGRTKGSCPARQLAARAPR
jgi:hypothetical protein